MSVNDKCAPLQADGIKALTRVKMMIHESQPNAPQSVIIKQHPNESFQCEVYSLCVAVICVFKLHFNSMTLSI